MLRLRFICIIVLILSVPFVSAAAQTSREPTPETPDLWILSSLWMASQRDGSLVLEPGFDAAISNNGNPLPKDDPNYRFCFRSKQYFDTHYRLFREDPNYKTLFLQAQRSVFNQLPEAPSLFEGRLVTYLELERFGILKRLIDSVPDKIGEISVPIENIQYGPYGLTTDSFIADVSTESVVEVTGPALIFGCCDGYLVVRHLGGRYTEYAERHKRLLQGDSAYTARFQGITKPLADKLAKLSHPLSVEGVRLCKQTTQQLREQLKESGLLAQLEGSTQSATRR